MSTSILKGTMMTSRDYEYLAAIVRGIARDHPDTAKWVSAMIRDYALTYYRFDPDIWEQAVHLEE